MGIRLRVPRLFWPILLLAIGYGLVALYLLVFLHYDALRSDVLGYWQDSLVWKTPFHPSHVPGYPLMIAFVHGVTGGTIAPLGLMVAINLCALLAGAFFCYRIIEFGGGSHVVASLAALLFGLWPLVGLTYAVNPLADMPAMALFLAGVSFLRRSRRLTAALFLGLSLITHKAMWIFVVLLVLAELGHRRERTVQQNLWFVGVVLLPIGFLWVAGSAYHGSITWLVSSNIAGEVVPKGDTLFLDGLWGTFLRGGLQALVKGPLLLSFFGITGATLIATFARRSGYFYYGVAISSAILLLFLILNQHEIWAAMRFGRLLVIPLAFLISSTSPPRNRLWMNPLLVALLLTFLFASQFVYAWYMASVYFG